jgi:hypothetical protein
MAVQKGTFTETQGEITISNGDLQALKKIARDYGIVDESYVIVFAIGILSRANGKPIAIEQPDGSTIKFVPSDKLRGIKNP